MMSLKKGSYKGGHWATRRRLLELLKTAGELSSQEMARDVGVSPMAIRQHMQELERLGDVASLNRSRGKGRPSKYWSLTPGAERHFPDRHRDLILDLLRNIQETLGPDAMDGLLSERADQQKKAYGERLRGCSDLEAKAEALAEARTEEGYMAETKSVGDGAILLLENHCPICSAASACAGLCAKELEVFRDTLGSDCKVERIEHLLSGGRRCAYRIEPKS